MDTNALVSTPTHNDSGQPGQKRTVCIFAGEIPQVPPWDPRSTTTGITGAEEAIIYLSEQLVKKGFQVTVIGNPPADCPYAGETANPRYVPTGYNPSKKFDIVVSWRRPWIAEKLKSIGHKVYFWPHDTCYRRTPQNDIDAMEDVFWLSKWHREQWISIDPPFEKFTNIYGNGINPDDLEPIKERANPYSCIYGSNYNKGLIVLLDGWLQIKKRFPKATLDIYYGWSAKESEHNNKIIDKFLTLSTQGVREHGLVGHKELAQAYANASFWTHSCIIGETFCISALKAQGSGAVPVIINGSALNETVKYGYKCDTVDDYIPTLIKAMEDAHKITLEDRIKMRDFVLKEYTWEKIADKWMAAFNL